MAFKRLKNTLEGLLYDNTVEEEAVRKMQQKSSSGLAIFVGLVAAVGGFLYGYDTGLINDIMEMAYVKQQIPANHTNFTVHERALVTAILSLGTFFGALAAPLMSDSYGRKFLIIFSAAVIFNAGNTLQVSANDVGLLCAGRAISGVAVGILSAIVPLYQAEASPKWVRGSIVFTYQWAITWGLLIALAVCQGTRRINSSASYRIPIGVQYTWSIVLCVGMLYLPESPRYFVQKNKIQDALGLLTKLRRLPHDDPDLIEELVEIKANYDYEMSFGKTTYLDCFRLGGGRHKQGLRMLTGIGVQLFQQCSGINFIFYYGVNFFASTGVQNYYLMSFITYLVNVIFTVPGIVFIDIIGRRRLLLLGGIGMAISNIVIAVVGVTMTSREARSLVSIVFSCCFIACFASSWGGCAWAICSDIYGISIRQKAVSITASTNWLVNFVFAYITPYLIDTGAHTAALGNKIFFIWGGCNALGIVFVYFMVYETKGLKLEEVDLMYQICANSRESTKFKSRRFDYSSLHPRDDIIQSLVNSPPNEWATDQAFPDKLESYSSSSRGARGLHLATGVEMARLQTATIPKHNTTDHDLHATDHFLHPAISNTSDESNGSSGHMSTEIGVSDYQKYLRSLHEEESANSKVTLTSFTSASILRGQISAKQHATNVRSKSVVSGVSHTGKTMANSSSLASAKNAVDEQMNLQINGNGNMKIIAAPFYNEPPSDSDSDD